MRRGNWAARAAAGLVLGLGAFAGAARADEPAGLPGKDAKPADYSFNLATADGADELSFQELADSNKPFILVWWLADCPVCHLQMPYVQQLQKLSEDGEADLRIVSINVDASCSDCLKYAKDRGLSFEILSDPRARATDKLFRVKELGTPLTFVFKPGGELVDYLTGFKSGYAKAVLTMLGQKIPESLSGK